MPYTPPSRSPSVSPGSSRSSSFSTSNDARTHSTLNLLNSSNPPRSATYLHKHRRSSSVTALPPMQTYPTSPPMFDRSYSSPVLKDPRASESLHQSPPPVDSGLNRIPTGAVISPPDSSQNSDEEDGGVQRGRNLDRLQEELLKEAIKNIPQRRLPSPDSVEATSAVVDENDNISISITRRKSSHHRSHSESSVYADQDSGGSSRSGSYSDIEDDAYRIAPPMVRKKSGEVVKSSLKSPNRSRPISVPSTPTFPKNVHFDATIEHVRHFLQAEKPSAVSAGSSPVESAYDGESEYPFGYDEERKEWEIELPNFPKDAEGRKHMPVRLEKICLSTDKKALIGTVAVHNLAFQKVVVARFTFDFWQTISEVSAEWSNDFRRKEQEEGIDRFVFRIKLTEQANLENKTLFLCIRYSSAGQEHWDNNGGFNFQILFKTKPKLPTSRVVGPRSSALPKSKPQHSSSRPRSMPNMSEFELLDDSFFQRAKELGIRTKDDARSKPKPVVDEEDTALPTRRANPSGNAFGGRYDFSASLSAAIKAANTPPSLQQNRPDKVNGGAEKTKPIASYFEFTPAEAKPRFTPTEFSTTPMDSPSLSGAGVPDVIKPELLFNEKPSIESPSYRQLLDSYCFYGTPKAAHKVGQKDHPKDKKLANHAQLLQIPAEKPPSPQYTTSPVTMSALSPPALSLAQHVSSGNTSPIPPNFRGYHHRRSGSGAFRFEAPHATTPTAIC